MLAEPEVRTSLSTVSHKGHCIDCPAQRGDILKALIGDTTHECAFDTQSIEARAQLKLTSLNPGDLVMVRRGMLIRTRMDASGHAIAVDALGSGASFVVPEDTERSCAYAVDRTLYCTISGPSLLAGLRPDDAGLSDLHELHRAIQARLERFSDARGRATVRARVAATLCTLADTMSPPQGRRAQLPSALLQRDIAALASTRHESVCRILREFSESGLVEHGPDGINILNHEGLNAI